MQNGIFLLSGILLQWGWESCVGKFGGTEMSLNEGYSGILNFYSLLLKEQALKVLTIKINFVQSSYIAFSFTSCFSTHKNRDLRFDTTQ